MTNLVRGQTQDFIFQNVYAGWRDQSPVFENIAAYLPSAEYTLTGAGFRTQGAQVTPSFLDVLGVAPQLGRNFLPQEGRPGGGKSVLLTVAGGGAQSLADREKPVWTMEILKVLPGQFGPTLGYLDDNWMRIREEAKRQGAVLSYHRIAEQSTSESDPNIVLLTEYKNQDACDARGKLFATILKQFPRNFPGELLFYQHKDLYETVSTQVFEDYQDTHIAEFRLVTKN